jgi:hypothetical protein
MISFRSLLLVEPDRGTLAAENEVRENGCLGGRRNWQKMAILIGQSQSNIHYG